LDYEKKKGVVQAVSEKKTRCELFQSVGSGSQGDFLFPENCMPVHRYHIRKSVVSLSLPVSCFNSLYQIKGSEN
jgi:hypothetical protein